MKKIMFYICLLFMPFFVFAEDTCNQDDIKIESIVLDSTSGNIEETSNPNADNNQVNLGLKMNVIDDCITYKIVITNTSNQDYTFNKNSLSTDYLNYDITYEDNTNVVKAGESKVIFLTVNYSNKPSIDKLNNGLLVDNPKVSFNLQKEEAQTVIEEVAKAIVNPDTKDVIGIFLLILIISLVITIILLRRGKKVKYITLLILTILLTSNIVKALCTCTLDINTSIEIDAKEAMFLPGKDVNAKMKELAGDDTSTLEDRYTFKNESIIAIKESEIEPSDNNKQEKNIVSTTESEYPIYMWFDNGTIYWWSEDKSPTLNEDSSYMFNMLTNINDISGLKGYDASATTDIEYMFNSAKIQSLINLINWNVSQVKNMSFIFLNCRQLESISGLETWDTSNVEDMTGVFNININVRDFSPIKNWNVNKVKYMQRMFATCFSVEEIDLSNWETHSLENISRMFAQSWIAIDGQSTTGGVLKRIKLSKKFDTSKVTDMSLLVYNNRVIEDYSFLKYLNTSNVENMMHIFYSNNGLTNTEYLKDWDVSKVTNMNGLFVGTKNLTSLEGLKNWNTSSVKDLSYLFRSCKSLTNLDGMENWNVSNVLTFDYMLDGVNSLSDASSINNWNISPSATYTRMFTNTQSHPEFTKVQGTWENGTFIPST